MILSIIPQFHHHAGLHSYVVFTMLLSGEGSSFYLILGGQEQNAGSYTARRHI